MNAVPVESEVPAAAIARAEMARLILSAAPAQLVPAGPQFKHQRFEALRVQHDTGLDLFSAYFAPHHITPIQCSTQPRPYRTR